MEYANTYEAFAAFVEMSMDNMADGEVAEKFPGAEEFFASMQCAREILILGRDTYADTWNIADVKSVAPYLNDEECRQVLIRITGPDFDANYGVSWSGIEMFASELRDERNDTLSPEAFDANPMNPDNL